MPFPFLLPIGPTEDGENQGFEVALPACHPDRRALEQLPDDGERWYRLRPDRAFGTPALLEAIDGAATRAQLLFPDTPPLLVGDLSREGGGPLPPHRWHADGRSADLGLYGGASGPEVYVPGGGFPAVSPRDLDRPRTWAVIESLLSTGAVEHVLLGQGHIDALKTWLLSTGRRTATEVQELFPTAGFTGGVVRPAPNHDDHLHVRIACE